MYRIALLWLLATFGLLLSCGEEPSSDRVIARINETELTLAEFENQLVSELDLDRNYKLTADSRREFLDQLIQKELLIQEAKRLELDRKEKFIRAIERYWEATLIRDLMEIKAREYTQRAYVSQEEIESLYQEMRQSDPGLPPLETIRQDLVEKLLERKKNQRLRAWVQDLRKQADIHIDPELLEQTD